MKGKEEIRTVIVCEASIIYRLYASSRIRQPLTKSWQCKKLWLTQSHRSEEPTKIGWKLLTPGFFPTNVSTSHLRLFQSIPSQIYSIIFSE